jgi:tRNA nucleotidyltransferase (CCA-adding enzyme)
LRPLPLPAPPGAVRWITSTLEGAGYETWAVGGAVRDALLGLPVKDWDLTTAAPPGRVRSLFPRTIPVGIEHGTVGVLARDGTLYEVTTFRRDVETDGRHAVVAFADTVEEDLARRDFTMNAVAWHPLRGEFRDPFGGGDDLRAGPLRTVGIPGERFREDRLRVLRALRFAARFRLTITPETWTALATDPDALRALSPERVREELMKVLSLPTASGGLALYAASGVLKSLLPGLEALRGLSHPAGGDTWVRSLLTADALSSREPFLRLAALLQDVWLPDASGEEGKGGGPGRAAWSAGPPGGAGSAGPPGTPGEPGPGRPGVLPPRPEFQGRGVRRALGILEGLRFSNAQVARVAALVQAAPFFPVPQASSRDLRRWLSDVGTGPLTDLFRLWIASARVDQRLHRHPPGDTVDRIRRIRGEVRRGVPLVVDDLLLDGGDLIRLGYRPGPDFGRVLRHLLDQVLDDPARNRRDWLEAEVARWMDGR